MLGTQQVLLFISQPINRMLDRISIEIKTHHTTVIKISHRHTHKPNERKQKRKERKMVENKIQIIQQLCEYLCHQQFGKSIN